MRGNNEPSGTASGFIAGAICGAVIGTVVGLLVATKPGEELRGQIAESASRFRRKVGNAYDRATETVNDTIDRGREAVRRGQHEFDSARNESGQNFERSTDGY